MQCWLCACVRERTFPFAREQVRGEKTRDREIFRWARGDFQMLYIEPCYHSSDFLGVAESANNSGDIQNT